MNLIKIKRIESISLTLFYLLPVSIVISKFFADFTVVVFTIFFFLAKEAQKFYKEKKIYYNFFIILFFLLITVSTLSSIFSSNQLISLKSSFLHFRFLFFALFISYLFTIDSKKNLKILFYIFLFCYLTLLIDGTFQFIFKKNIFGYVTNPQTRVSSLFFDELVLGSYISRLFPILVFLYVYLNIKFNKYLIFYFLIHLYFINFITGERLAFVILNIYYFVFSIFLLKGKILKISFTIAFILFFLVVLTFSQNFNPRTSSSTIINQFTSFNFSLCEETKNNIIQNKYLAKKYKINKMNTLNKQKSIPNCDPILEFGNIKIFYIFSLMHHNHFISATEIFKNNFLLGVGPKNFRYVCGQKDYYINEFSCSTHPHNYTLQILSETGLLGFLIFILIYLGFLYLFIKELIFFKRNISVPKLILITTILINFFPLFPSGSFFNNWNSILYTIPLGMLLGYYKESVWK